MNVAAEVLRALGEPAPTGSIAVAWGAVASGDATDAGVEAEIVGSSWRLRGDLRPVLWPEEAGAVLAVARSKVVAGRDRGLRVYRVPLDAAGCSVEPWPLLAYDARRVRLDGVDVADTEAIGPPRDASAALATALDRLRIAAVGEMVDIAQRALDLTVARVGERVQFGAPLATRQAVQHRAADMAIALAAARALHEDATAAAARGACAVEAAVAKLVASERLPEVTAGAHQLHGGEGYYADRDLHVLHKQVCTLAALFGNGSHQRVRLAALLAE